VPRKPSSLTAASSSVPMALMPNTMLVAPRGSRTGLFSKNSYFKTMPDPSADPELLKLSTDKTLFDDDGFKPFAENFRDSQDAFFESYAKAQKKLSELGSKFEPVE
jgi:hypothetical protein